MYLIGSGGERANLSGANLSGAKNIMAIGPMPTSGRIIYAVRNEDSIMVQAGCFWGTVDELEREVKANHNCPVYLSAIEMIKVWGDI